MAINPLRPRKRPHRLQLPRLIRRPLPHLRPAAMRPKPLTRRSPTHRNPMPLLRPALRRLAHPLLLMQPRAARPMPRKAQWMPQKTKSVAPWMLLKKRLWTSPKALPLARLPVRKTVAV